MNLVIVVPCFNEAERLPVADFLNFVRQHPEVQLCFVNDGSKDNTLSLLNQMMLEVPGQICIKDLPMNQGKANAVREGFLCSLKKVAFDRIAFLDADLSTPLEECWRLAQMISEKKEFIFGSRIKKLDNTIDRKWHRFLIGRMVATVISKMLKIAVYDTQCGCKVFSTNAATQAMQNTFISKWLFDVEIFYRLKSYFGKENLVQKSEEVPLNNWRDVGVSKVKWTYFFVIGLDLFFIYKKYRNT